VRETETVVWVTTAQTPDPIFLRQTVYLHHPGSLVETAWRTQAYINHCEREQIPPQLGGPLPAEYLQLHLLHLRRSETLDPSATLKDQGVEAGDVFVLTALPKHAALAIARNSAIPSVINAADYPHRTSLQLSEFAEARGHRMTKTNEKYTAFGFGVVFVVVMLSIALLKPVTTPFQYWVFRVVLSLAAAGVAAMVPGFLIIDLNKWIRAGGALAVFAVLYFYNPASLVAPVPPPLEAAVTVDAGTYDAAELLGILESKTGGIVIDQALAGRIQGETVTVSSPWSDVALKAAFDQVFGQLGVAVVYDKRDGTVIIRERRPQ
jgi:hypothetical protein